MTHQNQPQGDDYIEPIQDPVAGIGGQGQSADPLGSATGSPLGSSTGAPLGSPEDPLTAGEPLGLAGDPETGTPSGAGNREDQAGDGKQQLVDTGVKTLYALAGLTDVFAEQLRKSADERQVKRQANQDRIRRMVADAPNAAQQLPDNVRAQFEKFIESFEELAGRGRVSVDRVRDQVASTVRDTGRAAQQRAESGAAQARDRADGVADSVQSTGPASGLGNSAAARAYDGTGTADPTAVDPTLNAPTINDEDEVEDTWR